jgi:hypothetical protein
MREGTIIGNADIGTFFISTMDCLQEASSPFIYERGYEANTMRTSVCRG